MVGLPVITELDEGALRDAVKTAGSALADAGDQAGVGFGKNFGAAATKEIDKASKQWERSYGRVADAAGKVRSEQAKLEDLRKQGVKDGARFITQSEKVAAAQRKEAAAAREAESAYKSLADAQKVASVSAGARAGRGFGGAFGGEMMRAIPGASRFANALSGYDTAAGKVGAAAGTALGMAFTTAAGGLLAAGAVTLYKGFQRYQSIDAAKNRLENLNRTLERTGKATIDVGNVMATVNEVVEGTPFSLDQSFSIATRALSTNTGPSLKRFMTVVADAAGFTGEEIGKIGDAFLKVANTGKVQANVLNNELRELPVTQWLAETMGKSSAEITKMVSKSKIGLEDLMKAVEFGAAGFAKGSVNTVAGAMDQLNTAIARIGANFLGALFGKPTDDANGLVGALNSITARLNDVNKWVTSHEEDIKRFFEMAIDLAKALGEMLGGVLDFLGSFPGGIKTAVGGFVAFKALTLGRGAIAAVAGALGGVDKMLGKTLPNSAEKGAGRISRALHGIKTPAWLAAIGTAIALDVADNYHEGQQDRFWQRHQQQQAEERLGLRPPTVVPGADGPLATDQLRAAVAAGNIPGYSIGPDGSIVDSSGNRVDFGGNAAAVAPGSSMQEAADAINRAAEAAKGGPSSSGSPAGVDSPAGVEPGGLPFLDPSAAGSGSGSGGGSVSLPYPAEYGRPLMPGETPEQWRAAMQRIEADHDLAERKAQLAELEAAGDASEADLIKARNAVVDAEIRLIELGEQQRRQRLNAPTVPLPAEYGQGPLPGETNEQWRARMRQIELNVDVEQKRANLLALMADNNTSQDELVRANHELIEAQMKAQEAATGKLKEVKGGLDDIGAALDDDLGLSQGIPGLADNLVRFVARLAMAPVTGRLAAVSAADPIQGGHGLFGILGARNIAAGRSPLFGKPDPSQAGYAGAAVSPSIGPPALQPGTALAIPTGQPRQYQQGMVPNNVRLLSALEQMFPNLTMSADTGRQDKFGEHGSGQALDIMTNANMALGEQINKMLLANAEAFGLQYTIWKQATHYPDGRVVPMEDRGSPTQNHMDHVHARVKPGPAAAGGGFVPLGAGSMVSSSGVPAGPSLGAGIPVPLPVIVVGGVMGAAPSLPGLSTPDGALDGAPAGTVASGAGSGPLPGPAVAGGGGGAGTGTAVPGFAPPPASLIAGVSSSGPPGAGGGMQGAVGGIPLAAATTALSAADMFMPGAGQAAQVGLQVANRTAGFAGQLAGIAASGIMETFSFGSTNPLADPLKSLPGRVLAGVAGARPATPNPAGQSQQGQGQSQAGGKDGQQNGGQGGPMVNIENVHQAPNQEPDSVANSVANQFKSYEVSQGFTGR